MRETLRPFEFALPAICIAPLLFASACDGGKDQAAKGDAASPAPAAASSTGASAPPPAPAKAGPGTLALPTDAKGLPTTPLDSATFLTDACLLLSAEQGAAFLKFAESDIALEKREQRDRGACTYRATKPETKLDVWFDSTKQLRSSEQAIELAGVADVRLRVLSNSAELGIPFSAAKDSSKMPADRLVLRLTFFHEASVTMPFPGPPQPEKSELEAVMRQLGENAIQRLGL